MVYDCISFFNELDLLEIRLNILKDVVDRFVLVEAGETHTGQSKPFYFKENESRFVAFREKIIYVGIDSFPPGHDAWWNENYQRNEMMKGLVHAQPEDRVLISDLDEIPDPEVIRRILAKPGVYAFRETSYAFYLNMRDVRTPYTAGTKMLSYHDLVTGFDGVETYYNEFLPEDLNHGTTVTKIRRREFPKEKGGERVLTGAGWHFTCLGGVQAILTKMRAVAPHAGFDPQDPSLTVEKVAALLAEGRGPALKINGFAVPLDGRFPCYLLENRTRYAHLIFEVTPAYRRAVRWKRLMRTLQGRGIELVLRLLPTRVLESLHRLRVRAGL